MKFVKLQSAPNWNLISTLMVQDESDTWIEHKWKSKKHKIETYKAIYTPSL